MARDLFLAAPCEVIVDYIANKTDPPLIERRVKSMSATSQKSMTTVTTISNEFVRVAFAS